MNNVSDRVSGWLRALWIKVSRLTPRRSTPPRLHDQQIFDNNYAVCLLIDAATGLIADANPAAIAFYGYPLEMIKTLHIWDINVQSHDDLIPIMRSMLRHERNHYEFQHRLASGQIRDVEVYISKVKLPQGMFIFSMMVDITEKRIAEARYRGLFEQSNDAVFILDLEGRHVMFNRRATELLGYTSDELANMSYLETLMPREQDASYASRQRLIAGEHIPMYERTFRHKNGSAISTEVTAKLVCDAGGQPLHIQSVVHDISERKRMQKALAESEEQFRTFFEQSNDGNVMLDESGIVIAWNHTLTEITGLTQQQVLGKSLQEIRSIVGLSRASKRTVIEQLHDFTEQVEQTGSVPWMMEPQEVELKHQDGTVHSVQAMTFPIKTVSGYRLGSIIRDTTKRKQIEAREFELALEKERIHLLMQFVNTAAHEFRTPLSIINTNAYLLSRAHDAVTVLSKTTQIEAQVARISKLLEALLLMVRLESREPIDQSNVDLRALLEIECHKLKSIYESRPQIVCTLVDTLPCARGDFGYLGFAFHALLENAIRFTPDTGTITLKGKESGANVWIEICDEGIGISDDDLPHIFEVFWRRDDAHSTPGFGLGLPIAQRIIASHQGTLTVVSQLGKGTTCRVVLPAAQPRDSYSTLIQKPRSMPG